jgi:hypothetical protein
MSSSENETAPHANAFTPPVITSYRCQWNDGAAQGTITPDTPPPTTLWRGTSLQFNWHAADAVSCTLQVFATSAGQARLMETMTDGPAGGASSKVVTDDGFATLTPYAFDGRPGAPATIVWMSGDD